MITMHTEEIKELEEKNALLTTKAEVYIKELKSLNLYDVIIRHKEIEHTLYLIIEQINKNSDTIFKLKGAIQCE